MPDPEVVRVMQQFKRDLLRDERTQMRDMASRWLAVERRLLGQLNALALEMANAARDGATVTPEMLLNQVRYRELLVQLTNELERYTDYAERTITDRQGQLARLGVAHAHNAIEVQGVTAGFNRLPVEAVEYMVGLAGDGSPLRDLLVRSWPQAANGLTNELVTGVALGYNPRKVARLMAHGMTGSLDRMMTIARTEQLRTYRTASLASYRASGVVEGYVRLSARDSRVCPGCLAADGEEYPLDVPFQSHPQCRCTLVPKVQGFPLRFQTGAQWFEEQPVKVQQAILGPTRYDLWASGQVREFGEFASIRRNSTWGDAIVPATVRELTGA